MKRLWAGMAILALLAGCSPAEKGSQKTAAPTSVIEVNDGLISRIEITKVSEQELNIVQPMGWESDCTNLDKKQMTTKGGLDDISTVINIGKQVWKILQDNEPILEARGMSASALPRGISCWNELSNWSPTRVETYKVSYKNLYGITVVDFKFRLMYNYGGRLENRGHFITNATVQYASIDVVWGYIFNADVEIPQVLNIGSVEDPVGGMQVTLNWSIKTRPLSLKKGVRSASFFIAGDGRATTRM